MKVDAKEYIANLQTEICNALSLVDGFGVFKTEEWERPDSKNLKGGGGKTRILKKGMLFEQAGVNFSEVYGILPLEMCEKLIGERAEHEFYATGVSLVIHPFSPMIPTTHANFRYLEVADKKWFGGGADLTPYYLFEEDAVHFHKVLKAACDLHGESVYPRFKEECDEYFYLPHRGEARGIGGIFFDYLGKDDPENLEGHFNFLKDVGRSFIEAYLPIVERRKNMTWTDEQKEFQLIRRGRYVEFNLLYDRGTLFGLRTNGRTESILMSLPPEVRWEYNFEPQIGTKEAELLEVLRSPRNWI